MPRKKDEEIEVLDLTGIKPENLLEIVDVVKPEEAVDLEMKIPYAGYDQNEVEGVDE